MNPDPAVDAACMEDAIAEARLGEGGTRPNPPVGAVLATPDGRVIARGHHRRAGGPHAETDCLSRFAGPVPRDATLYVTLEPCSTPGRVGACTDAIVAAGVRRVVCACTDPNPKHAGRGFGILREAGVEVVENVRADAAGDLIAPFAKHVLTGLPYVTLKMAQSLDGAIADHAGVSRWISGPESRAKVAAMRRRADVVLVGAGTVLADDPSLLRKDPGKDEGLPGMRCVLDARGRIPPSARVFTDGHAAQTVVIVSELAPEDRIEAMHGTGATVVTAPLEFPASAQGSSPMFDLSAVMRELGGLGFMHVLCEGGAALASSLVNAGLVDSLSLFVAPIVLGRDSLRTFGACPFDLPTAPRFSFASGERLGDDLLLNFTPENDPPVSERPVRGSTKTTS